MFKDQQKTSMNTTTDWERWEGISGGRWDGHGMGVGTEYVGWPWEPG